MFPVRPLSRACLLILLALPLVGCETLLGPPEPDREPQEGPLFDAQYYRLNAQVYFDRGKYSEARSQWQQAIEQSSDNDWISSLGLAACDLYEGRQRLAAGDTRAARGLFDRSEEGILALWDGTVSGQTLGVLDEEVQQWKGALTMADLRRAQAELAAFEDQRLGRMLAQAAANDTRRGMWSSQRAVLKAETEKANGEAYRLFAQLAAMENAVPNAIVAHAEYLELRGEVRAAEKEFLRFVEIAALKMNDLREGLANVERDYATEQTRRLGREAIETKLASNVDKQVAILDRLGRIYFQRAMGEGVQPEERDAHLRVAIAHLERARRVAPERLNLYSKLAQLEGEMKLYESALDRVKFYLEEAARRGMHPDDHPEVKEVLRLQRRLRTEQAARRG